MGPIFFIIALAVTGTPRATAILSGLPPSPASHRPGDEADGGPMRERLYSIDRRVANSATGTVRLHLGPRRGVRSLLEVDARFKSLPAEVGRVYRLWVVDDFVSDGILIKTFRTDSKGNAQFKAERRIQDVQDYRRIVVTIETPRLKRDLASHGPTVMEGVQPLEGE